MNDRFGEDTWIYVNDGMDSKPGMYTIYIYIYIYMYIYIYYIYI